MIKWIGQKQYMIKVKRSIYLIFTYQ